jgi:hydroxymethylpyrimidine pyrophosphatase-like HAD family hydrolase
MVIESVERTQSNWCNGRKETPVATETVERTQPKRSGGESDVLSRNLTDILDRIPPIRDIPSNTVIALDVHGTLISRHEPDDLRVVQAFRQTISAPAKATGAKVVMTSAAPTRELQRVASLLDLGDQPAVAELGHVIMPAVLQAPPRLPSSVSTDMSRALLDLRRWLLNEGLPSGVFLEPKTVLVSLNWSQAPQRRDELLEAIRAYIGQHGLPLYVSVSDATLDVGIAGVNKASGLSAVMSGLELEAGGGHVLAVGDSRNDLDLLGVASPGLCGCPSNSHPAVKEHVRAQGGIVSKYPSLAGTLDALSQLLEATKSASFEPARPVCSWYVRNDPSGA